MLSVMPGPMCSDEVVEWYVFAGSFDDCVCGGIVVTKLYVDVGKERSYEYRCDDGCPCFKEINEGFVASEMLE